MNLPSNFDSLSPLEKRTAVEQATGLTWEQYTALPENVKLATLAALKGQTVQGTIADMLGAARSDSFWNRVGGYVSGMSSRAKIASFIGVAALVWLLIPTLKSIPHKARAALA